MLDEQTVLDSRLSALPDRIRLPIHCDPHPLTIEAAALPASAWTRHFVPDNYQGDWSVIPLRAPAGAEHPIMKITSPPDCTDWVETEFLAACPSIRAAMELLDCEIDAARLMRLGPASEILEHYDHDLSAEYGFARLHIPLTTNPETEFRVNRQPVVMQPGEYWYLRLSDPHAVVNRGLTERIHLVVDVRLNDSLSHMLCAAAVADDYGSEK
jgi:Aspartyl/Asparaginyl beta-hydroxylase